MWRELLRYLTRLINVHFCLKTKFHTKTSTKTLRNLEDEKLSKTLVTPKHIFLSLYFHLGNRGGDLEERRGLHN